MNAARLPAIGDSKTVSYSIFFRPNRSTYCDYQVEEQQQISTVNETIIRANVKRKSTAYPHNSNECPAQHPDFRATGTLSAPTNKYRESIRTTYGNYLEPEQIFKNKYVSKVTLIKREHLIFKNVNTLHVTYELVHEYSNKIYYYDVYASMDSLFLNILRSTTQTEDHQDLVYENTDILKFDLVSSNGAPEISFP